MKSLVWFRRDLRVRDNPALHAATHSDTAGVIGLFIVTPGQWQAHDDAACKVKFWLDNLSALSSELARLNIPLRIENVADVCGSAICGCQIRKKTPMLHRLSES